MLRAKILGAVCAVAVAGLSGGASATDLAKVEIVDNGIPKPLTSEAGDALRGREVMIDRKSGNCLACHAVTALKDQPYHGEVGPPLDGVATRWSDAELRLIIVNSKAVFEGTIMPAFHATDGLNRVMDKFAGRTIISAQDVEDVLAYLKTLNEE